MMTLDEVAAHSVRVMIEAKHDLSWTTVTGNDDEGRPYTSFIFVTVDRATAEKAIRVLGAAGLLCETPLYTDGAPDNPTTADVVNAVVRGLRILAA